MQQNNRNKKEARTETTSVCISWVRFNLTPADLNVQPRLKDVRNMFQVVDSDCVYLEENCQKYFDKVFGLLLNFRNE